MRLLKMLGGLLLVATLAACGGGGGSPGSTGGGSGGSGGGSGGSGSTTSTPTLTVELITSTGAGTSTVSTTSGTSARATVKDGSGAALSGVVVTFTTDASLVRTVPASGSALTNSSGVATVQLLPADANSAGAGTLNVGALVGTTALAANVSYQVPSGASDTATSRVANFVLLLDRSTLSNAGTATAKLTVVALDASNNVVPGAAVTVSTNANTVFIPGGSVTDAQGQYSGQIGYGGDKSDRTVVATVTVNNIVKQTSLQITGSQLELTVTPTLLAPGGSATLTARVTDGASAAIASKTVTFVSDITTVNGRSVATDVNGRAVLTFTAPTGVGAYTVAATGSGVTTVGTVQVGTAASIAAAVIPAGSLPSVTAIPNVVAPNTAGSTTSQSQVRFLFLDPNNQPIPRVRVRFDIVSTGLGSFDSTISTGTTTVYTSAAGVATAIFIPGTTVSPTDGVVVRACYQATDFTSTTQCAQSVEVHLTVAAQALAVSVGDDNLLGRGSGTYIKRFTVTVADAAGRAVAGAPVDISLDITHFGKGQFSQPITFPLNIEAIRTYVPNDDPTVNPATFGSRVSCINEDRNRNGFVDPGENTNNSFDSFGQPTLEPRRSDIILSYDDANVRTTNASGVLVIKVEYSQRFATWLSYRVRATTSVSGSQGNAERAFVTNFILGDDSNGSFLVPPYGEGSCSQPG